MPTKVMPSPPSSHTPGRSSGHSHALRSSPKLPWRRSKIMQLHEGLALFPASSGLSSMCMLRRHDGKANQSNETKSSRADERGGKGTQQRDVGKLEKQRPRRDKHGRHRDGCDKRRHQGAAECGRRGSDRKLQEPDVDERDDARANDVGDKNRHDAERRRRHGENHRQHHLPERLPKDPARAARGGQRRTQEIVDRRGDGDRRKDLDEQDRIAPFVAEQRRHDIRSDDGDAEEDRVERGSRHAR